MTCTAAKTKCFGEKCLPAQQQPNILNISVFLFIWSWMLFKH